MVMSRHKNAGRGHNIKIDNNNNNNNYYYYYYYSCLLVFGLGTFSFPAFSDGFLCLNNRECRLVTA